MFGIVLVAIPRAVPLTLKDKEELDHRLDTYHKNPSVGSPWLEIKKKILSGK